MKILFWLSAFALYYVYHGYGVLLRCLVFFFGEQRASGAESDLPKITVLLTVHNEEKKIERRVTNLLASNYPRDRLEILIASDGSTDGTEAAAKRLCANPGVALFSTGERVGKTETQNRGLRLARSEIIVFTDAEAEFREDTLRELIAPFADPRVGGCTGNVVFRPTGNIVSENQGRYWDYEIQLREHESALGILAVASGQCMAARKDLLKPMEPFTGEDCIVPLDIVLQGFRFEHCRNATAYDVMESATEREFSTRARMTLRNWMGTLSRRALLNPLRHPGYAFSLFSHKIFRWLSPTFIITATVSLVLLAQDRLYFALLVVALCGFALAFAGWIAHRAGRRIPVASALFSFMLANLGFLVGLVKALSGEQIVTYRSGTLEKHE